MWSWVPSCVFTSRTEESHPPCNWCHKAPLMYCSHISHPQVIKSTSLFAVLSLSLFTPSRSLCIYIMCFECIFNAMSLYVLVPLLVLSWYTVLSCNTPEERKQDDKSLQSCEQLYEAILRLFTVGPCLSFHCCCHTAPVWERFGHL